MTKEIISLLDYADSKIRVKIAESEYSSDDENLRLARDKVQEAITILLKVK